MFFCFGENEYKSEAMGSGETAAEAIKDWAYNTDWPSIRAEFNHYAPAVFEGKVVKVAVEVPDPIPPIVRLIE